MPQGTSVYLDSPKAWEGRIDWSYTQSIADNCSYVTAVCYEWKTDGSNTGGNTPFTGELQVGSHTAGISFMTARPGETEVASIYSAAIYHNSDGTGSVYIGAYIDGPTDMSSLKNIRLEGGQTFTLPTIPRDVTLDSAENFNDDQNPTITYTNQAGTGCKNLIGRIDIANVPNIDRNLGKTSNSYTFQLTQAELESIYKAYPNDKSISVDFVIGFRFDYGAYKWTDRISKTLTIVNANPVLSPTVYDTNQVSIDVTGDRNILIAGVSNAYCDSGAAAVKGASISSQSVTNGSKVLYSGSGTIEGVESGVFDFTAIDTRGNVGKKRVTMKVTDYIPLTCNIDSSAHLEGETTASISIKAYGNFFNGKLGSTQNSLRVWYRYKQGAGDFGGWIEMSPTVNTWQNTYEATATLPSIQYTEKYVVQVSAADAFHADLRSPEVVVQAVPIFDWSGKDFVFHVPVFFERGVDGAVKDFVVASGISGSWIYRKWNSGIAECWVNANISSSVTHAWGGIKSGDTSYIPPMEYPFNFVDPPIVTIGFDNQGADYWLATHHPGGTAKATPAYQAVRGNTISTLTLRLSLYAIGRWK